MWTSVSIPTTSVYLRSQHNLASIQNGRQQQPGRILVLRANLRRKSSFSSSLHHLYTQLSNRKPIPGFNMCGRNQSPEPKGRGRGVRVKSESRTNTITFLLFIRYQRNSLPARNTAGLSIDSPTSTFDRKKP